MSIHAAAHALLHYQRDCMCCVHMNVIYFTDLAVAIALALTADESAYKVLGKAEYSRKRHGDFSNPENCPRRGG